MRRIVFFIVVLISCQPQTENPPALADEKSIKKGIQLIVLGNVQDAGSPHAGCNKRCCKNLFDKPDPDRKVVSLGIVDHENNKHYLLEATPDLPHQMEVLARQAVSRNKNVVDGLFITHAHIGHYTGLMYLGRESMNAMDVPTYVMPRMANYLQQNGPWDQLVALNNIYLKPLSQDSSILLSDRLSITPFIVPHRDEYSETVGFKINGPNLSVLFIPDIDKWEKWDRDIINEIKQVDFAFLDATFFDKEEIPNRNMDEIPHPFVVESMKLFNAESDSFKAKIYFIHLNHTNPLLDLKSSESAQVLNRGYNIARFGQVFDL